MEPAAGLEHSRSDGQLHKLRHTYVTRLAAAGVPARTIMDLAGHRNLSTTMRYMHLYGITSDALFEVAHSTREYAINNPNAFFYQRSFTREEYDNSKMISSPLRLFDCCQESDGGSAVIVTTPERARDLQQPDS